MLASSDIVKKYNQFFKDRGHEQINNSPLVLQNDPTTLFTSSGMQPLVPYLLGEAHPQGTQLVNVQNCFRAMDIEEVGDNRHDTFFRMLGNWSLGDYFKEAQLPWVWELYTKEFGLPPEKLYVTVFAGNKDIPRDEESAAIWKTLLNASGLHPEEHIFYYGDDKNWWSRSGAPANMPAGEPGGPDSELFYEFTDVQHDPSFGEKCHPNCDCGRFMEIGNSVFMQYIKQEDGSFRELPQKNVDFGGGLERLAAALNNNADVFTTDLYADIITTIESNTNKHYADSSNQPAMRIIADHMKASCYFIADNLTPSNKEHGYILRRLLRRAAVKMHQLNHGEISSDAFKKICDAVITVEEHIDERTSLGRYKNQIHAVIEDEITRFTKTLDRGLKEVEKNIDNIDEKAFDLYQSYGFPFELLEEIVKEKGQTVDKKIFELELKKHKEQSRTASVGMFRGGLADHSEKTVIGHTATHLLHQALRDVLGNHLHQTGSNITAERVRFDFNYENRLTDEQLVQVETIVNEKIKENLPVHYEMLPTKQAQELGAIGLFEDTYAETSKIYFIGDTSKNYTSAYSIEFCGGPHVEFTGTLKSFKIIKQDNLGKGQKRLYARVGS